MNNKSGSEQKCDECDFPYSYDPTDGGTVCVRCLKEKRDHLQKLCEEQKGELEAFKKSSTWYAYKTVVDESLALKSQLAEQKGEIAELKFVLMQRDAELTMRNDQLEKVRFQSDIYAKQVVLKEELVNERSAQLAEQKAEFDAWKQGKKGIEEYYEVKSQLATQTERVRIAVDALEEIAQSIGCLPQYTRIDAQQTATTALQALNQESLGDGK